jgi:hypothetical protein
MNIILKIFQYKNKKILINYLKVFINYNFYDFHSKIFYNSF